MRDDRGPDPGGFWHVPSCGSYRALEILHEQGTSWNSASPMQRFSAVIAAKLQGHTDGLNVELLEHALVEMCGERYPDPRSVAAEFHDLIVTLVITSIAAGNRNARDLAQWTVRWFGSSLLVGALSSEARYEQREKEIRRDEMLRTVADLSLNINDVAPEFLRLLTGEAEGGS